MYIYINLYIMIYFRAAFKKLHLTTGPKTFASISKLFHRPEAEQQKESLLVLKSFKAHPMHSLWIKKSKVEVGHQC